MRILRFLLAAAALATGAAHAQTVVQTQIGASPVLEVQRIAPQLVQFAGGAVNFENLVNGLSLGLPITLSTPLAGNVTQVVTFTPAATLTPLQVAVTLENARQTAIGNGIAAPTAAQLGVLLNGGALPTALGTTPVTGLIAGSTPIATSLATQPSVAATLQSQPRFQASRDPTPGNLSDSPILPGLVSPPATLTPLPSVTASKRVPGSGAAGGSAAAGTAAAARSGTAP